MAEIPPAALNCSEPQLSGSSSATPIPHPPRSLFPQWPPAPIAPRPARWPGPVPIPKRMTVPSWSAPMNHPQNSSRRRLPTRRPVRPPAPLPRRRPPLPLFQRLWCPRPFPLPGPCPLLRSLLAPQPPGQLQPRRRRQPGSLPRPRPWQRPGDRPAEAAAHLRLAVRSRPGPGLPPPFAPPPRPPVAAVVPSHPLPIHPPFPSPWLTRFRALPSA
jgi:hypothetical protein